MIPVNPTYLAERQTWMQDASGKSVKTRQTVKVVGIVMRDDEAMYVVEVTDDDGQYLSVEGTVKRLGPSAF